TSAAPTGGKFTTTRIGLDGQACAWASPGKAAPATATTPASTQAAARRRGPLRGAFGMSRPSVVVMRHVSMVSLGSSVVGVRRRSLDQPADVAERHGGAGRAVRVIVERLHREPAIITVAFQGREHGVGAGVA